MLPKEHPDRVVLQTDRIKHWLSVGALPSDRVARFLGGAEIIPMPAIPEQTKKSQPRPKTLERMKEDEEKAKAAARSEARCVGTECVRQCRSRWSPGYEKHIQKTKIQSKMNKK